MKQTEQISLGGYAFTIETDALELLQSYLGKVRNSSREDVREELVSDIEERLAEIFLESLSRGTVVGIMTVQSAIDRIGVPSEEEHSEAGSEGSSSNASPSSEGSDILKKRFYRNVDDRLLGGVASGLAGYLNIDPFLLRFALALVFIIAFCFLRGHLSGELLLLYILVWIIAPASKTHEQKRRAEGRPVNFDEFKSRAESFAGTMKESVEGTFEEARTSRGIKAFERLVAVCVGMVLTVIGMTIIVTDVFSVVTFNSWIGNVPEFLRLHGQDAYALTSFISDPLIKWSFVAMISLFGITFLYGGVILLFDIKTPKWRPGMIILLLVIAAVLIFGLCVAKHAVEFYNVWQMV